MPVIRDIEFANRLATACENSPHAPSGHGRGRWLIRRLQEDFSVVVSPEAVRKWFAGEARPKPEMMNRIAQVLQVDEAWLSLGINPSATPREKKRHNALTNGAVNLVAAQIQLAGGNIAFPEDGESDTDLFAIVRGKQHALSVRFGDNIEKFVLTVPFGVKAVIGVVPTKEPTVFNFFRVPETLIKEFGKQRGGFVELEIEQSKKGFTAHGQFLPLIRSFDSLDGEPTKTTTGLSNDAKRALDL